MNEEKRQTILRQLAEGELSIEDADRLLEQVEFAEEFAEEPAPETENDKDSAPESEIPPNTQPDHAVPAQFRRFKWVWVWVMISGVIITLLGAFGMYNGYEQAGLGWGFWLSWIPLLLGIIITTLALATSNSMWLHVRVNTGEDEWPRRIAISLPLPMFLLRLGMRMGKFELDGLGKFGVNDVDALLKAIQDSDVPLTVHVDEGGGEKVEVYIGK
ncbi:MAG: hypothetical protein HPY85_13495 [Anaerolineae bacterium]|nr:hypothetical protein [Anaerolineae bacterium]